MIAFDDFVSSHPSPSDMKAKNCKWQREEGCVVSHIASLLHLCHKMRKAKNSQYKVVENSHAG